MSNWLDAFPLASDEDMKRENDANMEFLNQYPEVNDDLELERQYKKNLQSKMQSDAAAAAVRGTIGSKFKLSPAGPLVDDSGNDAETFKKLREKYPEVDPAETAKLAIKTQYYSRLAATLAGDFETDGESGSPDQASVRHKFRNDSPGAADRSAELFRDSVRSIPPEDRDLFLRVMQGYMGEREIPERSFGGKAAERLKRGEYGVGKNIANALVTHFGNDQQVDDHTFESQIDAIRRGADPATSSNLVARGALAATEMVPALGASAIAGAATKAGSAAIGLKGAVASIASGSGPFAFWYSQTQPSVYNDLREAGIDKGIADNVSKAASIPIALIEQLQTKQLAPEVAEAARRAAMQSLGRFLKSQAGSALKTYGMELGEEGLQAGLEVASKAVADYLDENNPEINWREELKNKAAELGEAAVALPFLLGPGKAIETVSGVSEIRARDRARQWRQSIADFDEAMKRGIQTGERIEPRSESQLRDEVEMAKSAAMSENQPVAPTAEPEGQRGPGYNEITPALEDEERQLYKEFYGSPEAAYWWARQNPEAAAKLAESKTYRPTDFTSIDPELPVIDGEGDAELRRQFRDTVRDYVRNQRGSMLDEADANDGTTSLRGWQRLPEGTTPPDHPSLEVQRTPVGTFVRLKPRPQGGQDAQAPAEATPPTGTQQEGAPLPTEQGSGNAGGEIIVNDNFRPESPVAQSTPPASGGVQSGAASPSLEPELTQKQVRDGTASAVLARPGARIAPLRAQAEPVLDLDRNETGWTSIRYDNGMLLIHPTEDRVVKFEASDPRSGTELMRQFAEAQAFAIDNPVQAPKPEPKKLGQKSKPQPPQADQAVRQGEVGMMLSPGEVVKTSSGRTTTPFPSFDTSTNRKTVNSIAKVDAWLRENAIEEAKSRNDKFNVTSFSASDPKRLTQAEKDSFEQYLFGEQPPVPRPLLKPLVTPSAPPVEVPGQQPSTPSTEDSTNGQEETDAQGQAQAGQTLLGSSEPGAGETPAPANAPKGLGKPDYGTAQQPNRVQLGKHFAQQLGQGKAYKSIKEARAEAEKLVGGKIEDGTKAIKDVDEGVEYGVVMAARSIVNRAPIKKLSREQVYDQLVDLYQRQPRLSTRTTTSKNDQAFSTPAPLAYLAGKMIDTNPTHTLYDSSAGNGMLLITGGMANTYANEINPDRAAVLRDQGFRSVNEGDGTQYSPPEKVDRIIINPPFGTVDDGAKSWNIDGFETNQVDHAIVMHTLKSLKDDGKAVLIIGSKGLNVTNPTDRAEAYLRGKNKAFFSTLYDKYNVTDHFTVDGDLYAKQGASFPIDVIVIDGVGKSNRPLPWNVNGGGVTKLYDTWEGLKDAKLTKRIGQKPDVGSTGGAVSGDSDQGTGTGNNLGSIPSGPASSAGQDGKQGGGRGMGQDVGGSDGQSAPVDAENTGSTPERERVPGNADGQRDQPGDVSDQSGSGRGSTTGSTGEGGRDGEPGDVSEDELGPLDPNNIKLDIDKLSEQQRIDLMMWQQGLGPQPTWLRAKKSPKKLGEKVDPKKKYAGTAKRVDLDFIASQRKQEKEEGKPKDKPENKSDTQGKIDQTKKEIEDLFKQLGDLTDGTTLNSGVNPQAMAIAIKLIGKLTQLGYYQFKNLVEQGVKAIGREKMILLGPSLEKAWDGLRKIDSSGKMDASTSVAEMLAEKQPEKKDAPQPPQGDVADQDGNEFQTPNKPRSKGTSVGTLVPKNHAYAYAKALDSVEDRYGDIDEFVARELGRTADAKFFDNFSAEQIDALALAIANHKDGNGFIIGDQTGVGKGRIVAAMIVYAQRQGVVPVFVTEKPNLFVDMIRDLTDIGANEGQSFNPLITNDTTGDGTLQVTDRNGDVVRTFSQKPAKSIDALNSAIRNFESGKGFVADVESGRGKNKTTRQVRYDAVFTTYSQLTTVKGNETDRRAAIARLARNSYMILDESHTAGGTEDSQQGNQQGPAKLADYMRQVLANAPAAFFSSATFAKRPQVMDLYAKAFGPGVLARFPRLAETIARGGVPLQQVISEMLAEAGVYMRREKSFEGIDFGTQEVKVDMKIADEAGSVFSAITEFDRVKQLAVETIRTNVVSAGGGIGQNAAASQAGVDSTEFASVMHNIIDQQLIALKADQVAEEAIATWKSGEVPVIAIDNTMEGLLDEWAAANNATDGDKIDYEFSATMHRYLEKVRTLTIKPDRNDEDTWYQHYMTDEELGPTALAVYNSTKALIERFARHNLTASPIDAIRSKLKDAGMRVAEVTGRKNAIEYRGGKAYLSKRPDDEIGTKGKIATVLKVNRGELDAVILNRSGAVGLSIHASQKNPPAGQRRRRMIIAQPAKNIDEFMQMLGRINRTGQLADRLPHYTLLLSDAPAETRPAAVLVKKLASLSANVTGKSKGIVQFDAPDIINQVGDALVAQYIGVDNPDLNAAMGFPVAVNNSGGVIPSSVPGSARKVTGRMPMMSTEIQKQFWSDLTTLFEQRIEELDALGTNPLTAKTLDLQAITEDQFPVFDGDAGSSNPFMQPASLERVSAKVQGKSFSSDEVVGLIQGVTGSKSTDPQQLKYAGERWADSTLAEWSDAMREYVDGKINGARSDAERDRFRQTFADQFNAVSSVFETYPPGTPVKVKTMDGEMQGVVTGIRRKGKSPNPMAPSTIAVDVAIADATRKITPVVSGIRGQNSPIRVDDEHGLDEAIRQFDEAQTSSREIRYIGTGNLLGAFDQLDRSKGRVVFYTNRDGVSRRGILMPKTFNVDQWEAQRQVNFESGEQVFEYIKRTGNTVLSPDKVVAVVRLGDGRLKFTAPNGKAVGGKYYLDKPMTAAAGVDWIKQSGPWTLTVPAGKEVATLDRLLQLTTLGTAQDKDVAQQVIADRPAPKKSDRDAMSIADDEVSVPSDVRQAMKQVANGGRLYFDNGWELSKVRINGKNYFELTGFAKDDQNAIGLAGFVAKKVGLANRWFLPEGDKALPTLQKAMESHGVDSTRQGNPTKQTVDNEARKAGDEKDGIAAADIIKTWERLFDIKIAVGGFRDRAAGIYKRLSEIVRVKEPYVVNLAVASHEIAHHIDKQLKLREMFSKLKIDNPQRVELEGLDYEPKGRAEEGWAEFLRHYITEGDTEQIAPHLHKWFEAGFRIKHPGVYAKIKEARDHATKYADQSILQRVRSAVGRPGDDLEFAERFKRDMNRWGNRVSRDWVDRFSAIRKAVESAKERGYDTSNQATPYELIMAHDMTDRAKAAAAVEDGVTSIRDGRKLGEGLSQLGKLVKNDEEYNEAVAYGWAKQTLFMADKRSAYNSGFPGGVKAAKEWVEYVKSQPDKFKRYDQMMVGLAEFNNSLIEMLVDAGALSRADADSMLDEYGDNYFPLHRAHSDPMQTGGGQRYVNLPKAVKGRSSKGSDRPILDPFDATIARAIHFYGRAAKARVANSLADMLDPLRGGVEGMGGLMDRIDPDVKPEVGFVEEILSTLVKEGFVNEDDARAWRIAKKIIAGENVQQGELKWFAERHGLPTNAKASDMELAAQTEPDITTQIKLWRQDLTPRQDRATVIIPDAQGNPVMYQLDRFLYDTVMGMDEIQHSAWTSIFRSSAKVMKAGATGVSSAFGVRNLIRDYIGFQGLAQVEGLDTLGKPIEMLPRYVAYKAREMAGLPTNDALIREFEELGGELYSPLGADIASRQRFRKKLLGQRSELSAGSVKDAGLGMVEGLQDLIAASDVPPRLAAMEQEIRNHGYEARDGRWYNLNTRHFVDRLPEHVRIRGINAAAEATVNFKRMGRVGRVVNAYSAYFNATIQGSYREWQQIKTLPSILSKGESGSKARKNAVSLAEKNAARYLVYLAAQAAVGAAYWALRHDDDDYREEESYVRRDNWTWGTGGRTYVTVPKPRDFGGYVATLVEQALDGYYHGERGSAKKEAMEATADHLVGRLPGVGGGFFRGLAEAAVDWDYFRGRSIEPSYTKDEPKTHRETAYTSAMASYLGKITGRVPAIGLSPAQLDHIMNQSTGGMYRRLSRTIENVADGKLSWRDIPGVSGIFVNRLYTQSVDDFYTEAEATQMESKYKKLYGEVDTKLEARKNVLNDYKSLMTEIRAAEDKDGRGRRTFEYEPYLVGLAREALNRPALPSSPDPFTAGDVPAPLRKVLVEFAERRAKSAILSSGYPEKAREGKTYEQTVKEWEAARSADEQWLKDHKDSPIVKQALEDLRGSKQLRDLLHRRRPTWDTTRETYVDHQREMQRWMDQVNNATRWLGDAK